MFVHVLVNVHSFVDVCRLIAYVSHMIGDVCDFSYETDFVGVLLTKQMMLVFCRFFVSRC